MDNLAATVPVGEDVTLVCQNSHGAKVQATVLRLLHHSVAFEVYSSYAILRASEVLADFKISMGESTVYSGRAAVTNLVNIGPVLVCEAHLDGGWIDASMFSPREPHQPVSALFEQFLQGWQKMYKILPEYKVVVADMQTFLMDMRLWLEQVELGILSSPSRNRSELERDLIHELGSSTTPAITALFERFEQVAERIEYPLESAHRAFGKRQLHPLLLS